MDIFKAHGLRLLAPSFSAYAGNPEILAVKKARGPAPADLHPPLITIFATATKARGVALRQAQGPGNSCGMPAFALKG